MCGICGFTGAVEADLPTLKAMCDVMAHRGPDGEGQYLDDGIALGHRRLSLIDLEGGNQPMVRATGEHEAHVTSPALGGGTSVAGAEAAAAKGDFAIVFNGEIYNYQDLRADLEAEGWAFQTHSDTEVLLTGYLAWGEAVLDRLRGMFAFAIWNRKTRELFCARDFFGIKPFYYTLADGPRGPQFVFASEIKCILEHPAYERALNEEALEQYLCFQFSALPETFFKGIFKLEPAHCLTVRADGTMTTRRYWRPTYNFDEDRSREDTVEAIDAAMRESVRYHNVADVEVGSFLSSGIDSSYMAACLAKENPDIKTFTVGFAEYEGERDEISWARELADELHIENDSKHISEEEYWASLPRVQWHMDEPSADPSAVALYFVDQEAAKKVKAVLSGEGADEFFGGYRIYQTPFANQKLAWAPKGLLRGASKAARALGVRGANYLERASETPEDWYYTNANGVAFSPEERERLRAGKRADGAARVASPQELHRPGLRRGGRPRRHDAHAVRRFVLLARGRHPAQDRQDVDGPFAGEPRAVPRQARVRGVGHHPHPSQGERRADEAHAARGGGARHPQGLGAEGEAGLSCAHGELAAAGPLLRAGEGAVHERAGSAVLRHRRAGAAARRAQGRRRPLPQDLDRLDVPSVVPDLLRGPHGPGEAGRRVNGGRQPQRRAV